MAREWSADCVDCGKTFSYSDATFEAARIKGESLPEVCPTCEKEFARERRTIGRGWSGLTGWSLPGPWSDRAIGHVDLLREPGSTSQVFPQRYEEDRSKFGVSDERLMDFYRKLEDPLVQVILVEAPTGAGKSTFFPFRLLAPPDELPDPRVFTRNGQIVVTQPRIQATKNIPAYVGKLYGCRIGARCAVGFRHSKENASDWSCNLVYLTDGTLINWIAGGQLANISLVMLDEAHERSLNIDLIIGLLTKMLPRYPWLKLVIASATIDHEKFLDFFRRHLRGGTRCERIKFEGKPNMPVRKHFRCGYVAWEDMAGNVIEGEPEPPEEPLEYGDGELKAMLKGLPSTVAAKCVELLERMIPSEESRRRKVPDDLVDRRGDILAFLHGEKPIEAAIGEIRRKVAANPALKGCVEVLPLYTKLPAEDQKKALLPPREGIVRVIISTNVAETSLTLQGIKHVVETGIINRSHWDTATETSSVRQQRHSQAGCKQRWGRAGRVMEGDAWCLYTKTQFDEFPRDTEPSILGTRLEPAVLSAKLAGVDRLDAESFPWLDPPPAAELERATRRLRQFGAIDADGDLTPHGAEIQLLGSDANWASLLLLADRFACAVEMATVLALLEAGGRDRLLLKERDWDAATSDRVKLIHRALTWGCRDDLELVLKVFAAWTEARAGGPLITASWAWPGVWSRVRKPLPDEARQALGAAAADLERRVAVATVPEDFDPIAEDERARSGPVQNWVAEARVAFGFAASETWAKLWCVNDVLLRELEKGRDDRIELLAVRKKEKERRPINFETLDRLRILLVWARPDLCFLRESEEEGMDEAEDDEDRDDRRPPVRPGPRYERLSNRIEALRRARSTDGGSTVEDDGEESLDEAVGPDVELILGDRTVCSGAEPDALIALGSQAKPGKAHPNSSVRDRVEVSFVVQARRKWCEVVPSMDLMGVSVYLAEECPPAPAAPPERRPEGAVRRRLFIDQRYPIFGQYRYRPLRKVGEGRWEVELIEPVGFWPESRSIPSPRRDSDEGDDEESVADPGASAGTAELCTEILVPILNESGEPILDPVSEPPEDVDDSDEDPDIGEEPEECVVAEPPPAPVYSLPVWRPILTVVELVRDEHPAEPIAEVVSYELIGDMESRAEAEWKEVAAGKDAAVERDLALVLRSPTPGLCFDLFSRGHAVGDRVPLLVEGHQRAGGTYISLVVRDPDSGYETQVSPENLGFLILPGMAERFPVGSTVEMAVDTIDPARQVVRFSLLPLLEELNGRILKAHGRIFRAEGTIVELSGERVTFLIDPVKLVPDLPPSLRLPLTAEIFRPDHKGKLPLLCERNRSYSLKFEFRERRSHNVPVQPVPAGFHRTLDALRERMGPHIGWDSEKKRLTYRGNVKDDSGRWSTRWLDDHSRREALAVSDHPGLVRAVETLYRRSNALDAEAADPDLEYRYPPGMVVRGVLVECGEPWLDNSTPGKDGKVLLDGRVVALIPRDEFRLGHPHLLGVIVRPTVLGSDASLQEIWATLRSGPEVIGQIRDSTIRTVASDLGLLDRRKDVAIAHHLTDAEFRKVPDRMAAAQRVFPWLSWAVLHMDPDHIRLIAGGNQVARRDIEQQTGAFVCPAKGEIFLLAPDKASLDEAVDGVRRRAKEHYRGERFVRPGEAKGGGDADPFSAIRREPVAQVATIPPRSIEVEGADAKAGARRRAAAIFGRLKAIISGA